MNRKIRSKGGQAIYALRKTIVEPVFDQIKGSMRLNYFLLQGLNKVNREWPLMATTHTIGKQHRGALATTSGRDQRSGPLRLKAESSTRNSPNKAGGGSAMAAEM